MTFAFQPRLREQDDNEKKCRTIEGYAILFGVRSQLLNDWYDSYYEVLEPGCVTRELLDSCDIKMTMFHNREKILARSNKGVGTLSYEVDDKGVKFSFEAPDTALGEEAVELVGRGDLCGCSFIYSTCEDATKGLVSYERTEEQDAAGNTILLRIVHEIERIYDFTIAADPAYSETSVSRRELESAGLAESKPIGNDNYREQVAQMRKAARSIII